MPTKPKLLIISFSPIRSDARVLKQVRMAVGRYHVTTCGYGEAPDGVDQHIQVEYGKPSKLWDVLLEFKFYSRGYWMMPLIKRAKAALAGMRFDVILANEIEALPLALWLEPTCGVHADLHEYYPRMNEEHPPWAKRIGPWYYWLCQKYLPQARSSSAVVDVVAKEFSRNFGIEVRAIGNNTPFNDLEPTQVHSPIRCVHSGTSNRERNIMALVEAVIACPGYTLDLYLTKNDPAHLAELAVIAEKEARITLHEPVPYDQLIKTLNEYDLGLHMLPPINYNFANTMPNKIFDFMQARLGAIVGPTPKGMADVVRKADFGVVTEGFTAQDMIKVLQSLTPEQITAFKAAAHAGARDFSAEREVPKWDAALQEILRQGGFPGADKPDFLPPLPGAPAPKE
ncbi:MAG: hypothetical protein Q3999_00310 [Buchananella hordeovulneris]|nr:hypothetical protein [Buchananella hordeovulneris]